MNNDLGNLISAANEIQMDGEWLRITPWGDFTNRVGLQRVRQDDAVRMVQAFNSLMRRAARGFRGVPIFAGHPDVAPESYPDRRRYGKVIDLETRDDGLYGKIAWNDLGQAAMDQGHYLYASPVWNLKRDGKFIRPFELLSIGLTNTPNIPGDAWAKNEPSDNSNNTMNEQIRALLLGAGIIKADATDQDILTATNELVANRRTAAEVQTQLGGITAERDRLKTDLAARDTTIGELQTQLTAANDATKTERQARISMAITPALADGRITEAEKADWETKFGRDFDGTLTAINELQPKVNTGDRTAGIGQRKGEGASDTITAINEAVRAYQHEHGVDYHDAYMAVKKTKPSLFETKPAT